MPLDNPERSAVLAFLVYYPARLTFRVPLTFAMSYMNYSQVYRLLDVAVGV